MGEELCFGNPAQIAKKDCRHFITESQVKEPKRLTEDQWQFVLDTAVNMADEKKHMDVAKPGEAKPDTGSKPMVVGHKPILSDPDVKQKEDLRVRPRTALPPGRALRPRSPPPACRYAG